VNGASQAVLSIISALGGTERRLLEWNGAIRRIDWSGDGRWLVTSPATIRAARDRGITFVSPTTGERIDWVALDKSYEESTDPACRQTGGRSRSSS
jgi:hypothetical protein